MKPINIVSGDQTGADRAALDWALKHNLPCGGWCPKGRKAEDGPIDPKYPLKETPSASYLQRTEWNVRDSDATVLFSIEPTLTGGSKRTVEFARKHGKPCAHLCARDKTAANALRVFVEKHGAKVLNVAGPRASKEPGVGEFVTRTFVASFGPIDQIDQGCS
jgi:Circularly permutated YpsA SLOG family